VKIKRAAPVLFVDSVEATRDFFVRMGFAVSVEIPDGKAAGFAILARDGVQVMVESRDNSNEPAAIRAKSRAAGAAHVFVEVDDLDAVIAALGLAEILVERHKTFYNSDELTYQEPGGNLVTFARFA
jgi:catechol 2,3-dioxygenase-like lactoylglutathione lyase family enzyme